MNNLAENLFATIDHASRRAGILDRLIDRVSDRFLPKATAQAFAPCYQYGPPYCSVSCPSSGCVCNVFCSFNTGGWSGQCEKCRS
jgi:hypothetical protein